MSRRRADLSVIVAVLIGLALSPSATGRESFGPSPVRVWTSWSSPSASAGDQRALAVVLDVAREPSHFHVNPSADRIPAGLDFLIPTTLEVSATVTGSAERPVKLGAVQWPQPSEIEVNYTGSPVKMPVYDGRVVLYVPLIVPPEAVAGDELRVRVKVRYQACDDQTCLRPEVVERVLTLPITAVGASSSSVGSSALGVGGDPDAPALSPEERVGLFGGLDASVFAELARGVVRQSVKLDLFGWSVTLDPSASAGLALLILLAAVGGFLLNLTPCVLPVIPIKVMGLSRSAGSPGRVLALGVTMSAGVVAFWLALGLATGALGWLQSTNELFQRPVFTIGVGVVIAAMAVGMCGLYAVRLPQWVYRIEPGHDTYAGSFGFGVMTAVLSTPCTAPFMGGAAAWAVTQPPGVTLSVFGAIGAGMALPYAMLSAFPRLIDKMPRTGPASELIKQVMGLLMLAASAYFIGAGLSGWMVQPPDPPSRIYWWAVAALVALGGVWLAYRTLRIARSPIARALFVSVGVAMLGASIYGGVRMTDRGPIDWTYFTPDRLAEARRAGAVVVLDFTAEWCLNCKVLEATVLHQEQVVRALSRPGVVAMKVDLTGNNEDGNAMLRQVGRLTIPTLVVMSADGRQTLNSDAYTPGEVLAAIRAAGGG